MKPGLLVAALQATDRDSLLIVRRYDCYRSPQMSLGKWQMVEWMCHVPESHRQKTSALFRLR